MRYYLFLVAICLSTIVKSQEASIPFEKEGLVYIPVKVSENEEILTFVFDTGASTAVMDKAVATRLGIKADTKQYATGASGSQEYEIAINRSLDIENIRFDKLNIVLVDLEELNNRSSIQIDGIIGYDVMSRFVTQFDFDHKKIHLYKNINDIPDVTGFTTHDMNIDMAIPKVTIDCLFKDGTTVSGEYLFDSGANLTILYNTPFAKKHQLEEKLGKTIAVTSRGLTATSTSINGIVNGITLLGHTFEDALVSISQAEHGVSSQEGFAGILGADIINRFDMILDYEKGKLYLKPNNSYNDPFDIPLVGFSIKKSEEKIVIGDVIKDTEAAQKDIASGDEILAINETSQADLKTYRELLKKEGKTIKLLLKKSSGKEEEIELTLKRLL